MVVQGFHSKGFIKKKSKFFSFLLFLDKISDTQQYNNVCIFHRKNVNKLYTGMEYTWALFLTAQ